MTDEELALLRAIVEQFDDDVPRLVYADWLEEHDRWPRAEFIRLQCHLHQALMNPAQREHFSRLIDNLQDFCSQHDRAEYHVPWPREFFASWSHDGFHVRGFPEQLEIYCRGPERFHVSDFMDLPSTFVPIPCYLFEADQVDLLPMILSENLLGMCRVVEIGPYTCRDQRIIGDLLESMLNLVWPRNVRTVRFAAWPVGSLWFPMLIAGNLHSLPTLSFPRADAEAASLYPELVARLPDRVQLH